MLEIIAHSVVVIGYMYVNIVTTIIRLFLESVLEAVPDDVQNNNDSSEDKTDFTER